MNSRPPCVVLVGSSAETLTEAVHQLLRRLGTPVLRVEPRRLAGLRLTIGPEGFHIEGSDVAAILWRCMPGGSFSEGFAADDQGFSDAETSAAWLAALHSQRILAINRFDAHAWFCGLRWHGWRRHLQQAGVPLTPFDLGVGGERRRRKWFPYTDRDAHKLPGGAAMGAMGSATTDATEAETCLVLDGSITLGGSTDATQAAASKLQSLGVTLATITLDGEEQVLSVNPLPRLEGKALHLAARDVSERLHAHWRSW